MRLLKLLMFAILAIDPVGHCQSTQKLPPVSATTLDGQDAIKRGSASEPFTLNVTAREVVVEVVATDKHGRPVIDLKRDDFEIFELRAHSRKVSQRISALRTVDPADGGSDFTASSTTNWVTLGRSCAMQTTPYYVLAYHPGAEGWTSGYHEILVTTNREHVKLTFRRRYYVGLTTAPPKPPFRSETEAKAALQMAACYHAEVPSSINISARLIKAGNTESLKYVVLVLPDSLAFTSLLDGTRRAQLDYGVCTFDAGGMPLRYVHIGADRVLPQEEYAQSLALGLGALLEIQRIDSPAFARIVVRDRVTGNLGFTGAAIPPVPNELLRAGSEATGGRSTPGSTSNLPHGPVSFFGLPIPRSGTFCGDVYELPDITRDLPDYWKLEPIGALFTDALNVPQQTIMKTIGIPGVTNRTAWFGIDYHGEFWVEDPGEYQFQLTSDDGAKLFIDDELVIDVDGVHGAREGSGRIQLNAGRHTVHVPYFQGPPFSVALVLSVKSPRGEFKPFDLRDFDKPEPWPLKRP
jgi:hypothetical protein